MLMHREPECYARYRQGLMPVAKERSLQAFISDSACQMEQSMKGHMPELLGGTSFRTGQLHGSTHVTPCQSGPGRGIWRHDWRADRAALGDSEGCMASPEVRGCVTCHSSAQCRHKLKPAISVAWLHDAGPLFDMLESKMWVCTAGTWAWPALLTALMTVCMPLPWQRGHRCLLLS